MIIGAAFLISLSNLSANLKPYADFAFFDFNIPGKWSSFFTESGKTPSTTETENTYFPDGSFISINQAKDGRLALTLHNKTAKTVTIATNGGPTVWLEAFQDNQWKPIQYIPLMCGNGAGIVEFEPGSTTSAPYTLLLGNFKTQIRAVMVVVGKNKTYSQPIDYSINPLRFTPEPMRGYDVSIDMEHGIPLLHYEEKPIKP